MDLRFVDDEFVWNIPLEKNRNSQFVQSWQWGVFQQTFGRQAWRLQVVQDDEPIAALQALSYALPAGKKYLYAPHGPVFFTTDTDLYETIVQDFYRGLKQITDKEKFTFARIEPTGANLDPKIFAPLGFRQTLSVQPQNELSANVSADEEMLLQSMHEKTRYNIRLATKHGIRTRLIEQPDYARRVFPMFWQMLQATAKRQKIRLHPDFENTVIAAHLLGLFGDTIYFLHGGSDYEYRQFMAPFLLHWEAMRLTKKLGKTFYNFGGVAPQDAADHPWQSLTRFKEGFVKLGATGERFHYVGGLDLVFQPVTYRAYQTGRRLRRLF